MLDCVLDCRCDLGEGPVWDADAPLLYFTDITAMCLHAFDPDKRTHRTIDIGLMVGSFVPWGRDRLLLATNRGFASLDQGTGKTTLLSHPESHPPGIPGNRFNEGKCDPAGRFWAGTMALDFKQDAGSLYRLDVDGSVHKMLSGVTISNGLAWTHDGRTMYFIDSPHRTVDAFDYDVNAGTIANRRTVIRTDAAPASLKGIPDGMTIDAEGMLWIAHCLDGCVARWDPSNGEMLSRIDVPATLVTSCTFGGPNLDDLYITTARITLDEVALQKQPLAGGLFRACVSVPGVATVPYRGRLARDPII